MEKINLNYNTDYKIDEIVSRIKKDPLGKKIIKELSITDEEIERHYELLNNYISINKNCLTCHNMNDCDHSSKGLKYQLKRDLENDLTDCFIVCNYFEGYYTRKKNLIYTTFDEKSLLNDKQKNFIFDNALTLGNEFVMRIIQILKKERVPGAYLQVNNSKLRLKLIQSLSYNLLSQYKVAIVKFSDLLKDLKSEFKINNGPNTFKIVLESDILIMDGLGNESITTWSRDEILLSLLDNRIQNDKITILCSEFSLDDLKKIYKINYNDDVKVNQLIDKINEIKI